MAVVEEEEELKTSLNWDQYNRDDTALATSVDHPFFVDSGATVHISPYKADFTTLQSIAPKAIKGVGGSSIAACGIGNIRLRTTEGNVLALERALYVPKSAVHLISISHMSIDNPTYSHFDDREVRIVDRHTNSIIAKGPLLKNKGLYTVDLHGNDAERSYTAVSAETWHRCLGHTNYQAIQQLTRDQRIKGATSPPLCPPPKCDSCILGK